MVRPSFTNHSSFVCCSLLDHWLCSYVHSSTIQPPLLGPKTKRIFRVLLWLGPLVQQMRKGPYLKLSVSSCWCFCRESKKAVVVHFILRWTCWWYYCVFLPYCVDKKSVIQLLISGRVKRCFYRYCFCSLINWFFWKSDEYLSQYLQLSHSEVAWLSWESEVQVQLYDIW